jgi:hypothetical protein
MTLNSLLTALSKSQPSGNSSWGGSHTWGGKTTTAAIPKFGTKRKKSESQGIADSIMAKSKAKGSKSHESFLGAVLGGAADVSGNLVTDVINTAENVPSGLYKIATTNPIDTAKAIGQDYKTRYGKLFSGDFGGFASDLKDHPLGYILDAATLGTSGAGALARAGVLSKGLSTTELSLNRASNVASLGETAGGQMALFGAEGAAKVPVNLSRNPLTRQVQKGAYAVQSKLPENIPVIGENAAASRSLATAFRHDTAHMSLAEKQIARDAYKGHFGEAAASSLNKYAHATGVGGVLGKSTQVWKDVVLAGRPAFQINNFLGNQGMYHLGNGVLSGSKSVAMAAKGELDTAANKFFSGSLHTFGGTEQGAGKSLYRRAVNKSYNIQGKHETALRKATMRQAAMSVPEIKTLVRKYTSEGIPDSLGKDLRNAKGNVWAREVVRGAPLTEGEALTRAMDEVFSGPNGRAIHREIAQKIDDTLGDYANYTAMEQKIKKVIPFYGWNRHASRYLYATARDKPGHVLALNQISKIGEQFHEDTGWQGTPDFMKGYLNIGGKTFDTAPVNPLKGATDTLKSVRQVVNGDPSIGEASSNLNPFIASGIQALTGKSLLTGAPIQKGNHGILGSVLQQSITGLPQWKLAMKAIPDPGLDANNPHTFLTPTGQLKAKFKDADGHVKLDAAGNPMETPNRHMLNSSFQSMLASFLGLPDRGTVNKDVAKEVAKKIETEKHPDRFRAAKKRKKKSSFKAVVDTQRKSGWGASQSNWGG